MKQEDDQELNLDLAALKTIEIYQKQVEFQEKVWSYLSLYSGLLFVLSLVLIFLSEPLEVSDRLESEWWWVIPAVAYLVVVVGNYRTLCNTQEELFFLRGLAISRTGLRLRGTGSGRARLFYVCLVLIALALYAIAVGVAYGWIGAE